MAIVQCLEQPNGQFFQYGVIQVEGWAFSTDSEIKAVEVRIGRKKYEASLGISREDVGKCHSAFAQRASHSGFRIEIKLSRSEEKKPQKLHITIVAENEQLEIDPVVLYPQGYRTGDTQSQYGLMGALKKVWRYLKAGKFPKNFDEWKRCVNQFRYIVISKPPTIGAYGLRGALKKVWGYLRAGKFPKNLGEWKHCIYRFRCVVASKPITVGSLAIGDRMEPYDIWLCKHRMDERKRSQLFGELKELTYLPLISIIMPAYQPDERLFQEAIQSVKNQIYPNWELIINDDCSPRGSLEKIVQDYADGDERVRFHRMKKNSNISVATNAAVELARGEFLFFMDHDDTLEENALFEVVRYLNQQDNLDIIYSDDDKISMDGTRYAPQFKPDYSPELLLSFMYFSHIFVVRKTLFEEVGGCRKGYEGAQDYDLTLRVTERTDRILHIPQILYHWRAAPTSTALSTGTKPESLERGRQAVADAIQRRNIPASVVMPEFAQKSRIGVYSLTYQSEEHPLISIVIPTKNHTDILRRCLTSIYEKTTYPNYQIVLVDDHSDDFETLNYYQTLNCRIVQREADGQGFNFSKQVNFGVANSDGEYIVLLNNDTEVITPSWLEELLVYMRIPGVGITGSKLLYADGLVQHAGVVLRMQNGVAGHAFKLLPDWDGGHMGFANVARNYSAVTAACFMTSKAIYDAVGGFDETEFGVSYNDVDFCLKVRKLGYRVVYNPSSKLYHHEGKSRGVEQTGHFSDPKEEYNLVNKWGLNSGYQDPYYNPNLSLQDEKFALELRQVLPRSWKTRNILLITHNLNYEGAPLVQLNVAKGLSDRYHFTVLSPAEGPLRAEYEAAGIPVLVVEMRPDLNFGYQQQLNQSMELLVETVKPLAADLVYANTIEAFWGAELGKRLDVPVIWEIHESVDYNAFFSNFSPEVAALAIRQFSSVTKVLFVADATAQMYRALDTMNFVTIRNGIDLKRIEDHRRTADRQTLRAAMGIAEDETVISIFGTVCFRKGQKVFAEAARLLLEQEERKLRFLIVGAKESAYLAELRAYLQDAGLTECVHLIPACDNTRILDYYQASDYFVCASYEESSPLVILEALAFDLPIVSTNVFGIPEQVRDGREALLTEPGDPQAIAAALKRLLDDPELTRRLTYNGGYRLRLHFTLEGMLREYDCLFQSVYEEGSNRVFEHAAQS